MTTDRQSLPNAEPRSSKPRLTAERLREVLRYDPATGGFFWKLRLSSRVHVGDPAGWRSGEYLCITVDGVKYKAHRLAWLYMTGRMPENDIDHANLIKSDNRFDNLREATRQQNIWNQPRPANNTSGYKGVCYIKAYGHYRAAIKVDGKPRYLGNYPDAKSAHEAYCRAARELRGDFARVS